MARARCIRVALVGVGLMMSWGHAGAQTVLYVDASRATGANDGSSWENAFQGRLGLAAALSAAGPGTSVWVADGVYAPAPVGAGRDIAFEVGEGVRLLGGFAGDEVLEEARDPAVHLAVLTGDLAGDDATAPLKIDNAAQVVRIGSVTAATVVDGFTITSGLAATRDARFPVAIERGGGMLVRGGSPVIRRCTFTKNEASDAGGGLAIEGGSALVESCVFAENPGAQYGGGATALAQTTARFVGCRFEDNGGGLGAGLFTGRRAWETGVSDVTVEDCSFIGNSAELGSTAGGGICDIGGRITVRRCRFESNFAQGGGAVFFNDGSEAAVDACVFFDNRAGGDLGDAWTSAGGTATFTNCLVWGHIERVGSFSSQSTALVWGGELHAVNCTFASNGGERGGGAFVVQDGVLRVSNSIVWNAVSFAGTGENALLTVIIGADARFDDCVIEGWTGTVWLGDRTSAADPMFADLDGADGVTATSDDDLELAAGSSCIDSGNNGSLAAELDLDAALRARRVDDPATVDTGVGSAPLVDRGALEYQGCSADLNGDGLVDFADYLEFLNLFDAMDPRVDFTRDGLVDFADYLEFLNLFELGC